MKKITVEYNGKSVEKEEVCDGIVKAAAAYLVRCCITGKWCYTSQERLDKLAAKAGSVELVGTSYVSREAKQSLPKPDRAKKAEKALAQDEKTNTKSAHDRWVEANIKHQSERRARLAAEKAARELAAK